MDEKIYHRLAQVLDTLPNGFPSTETGVEIKLLKKVFTPDEAELFCDLTLTFETASQIAELCADGPGEATVIAANIGHKDQLQGLVDQTRAIDQVVAALELNTIAFEGSDSLDAPEAVFD